MKPNAIICFQKVVPIPGNALKKKTKNKKKHSEIKNTHCSKFSKFQANATSSELIDVKITPYRGLIFVYMFRRFVIGHLLFPAFLVITSAVWLCSLKLFLNRRVIKQSDSLCGL